MTQPWPIRRRWNADLKLGLGGLQDYLEAANEPGESGSDRRMPSETSDGSVKIKYPVERSEDGQWARTPLFELPNRVQQHEFLNELKKPNVPIGVDTNAYFLAPTSEKMKDRLRCHETNFRKAGSFSFSATVACDCR